MNEDKIIKVDDIKHLSCLTSIFTEKDIKATALWGQECATDFYKQLKDDDFPLAHIANCTEGLIEILTKDSLSEEDVLIVVNVAWDCQQYLEEIADANTLDDSEYEWLHNEVSRDKYVLSEMKYQDVALRLLTQIKAFLECGDIENSYIGYLHLSFLC